MTEPQTAFRRLTAGILTAGLLAAVAMPAKAFPLLDGLGGDAGFGDLAMGRNDDGSSNGLPLPFALNFFGTVHETFFINNNGNVTFESPTGQFTPDPFPASSNPMIAPFWGDVDTRCGACGAVYVAAPNSDTVVVTWNNVGYFSSHSDLTNNFQLILRNQSAATGHDGDFDIEFRFDRLEWVTGDASGGQNGFGGTAAQAGFDAGDGVNFFTIPGSQTQTVHEVLAGESNVSGATPGLWSFAIRQGGLPDGSTPDNPLLPIITEDGFVFDFEVELNQTVFIDPVIAIGYEYIVNSGPNVASVLLPTLVGDDGVYQVSFNFNGSTYDDVATVLAGQVFGFGGTAQERFLVEGIDEAALLDPDDNTAFVAGLTFAAAGQVNLSQIPLTIDTGPAALPEPGSFGLVGLGLLGLAAVSRRRALRTEA